MVHNSSPAIDFISKFADLHYQKHRRKRQNIRLTVRLNYLQQVAMNSFKSFEGVAAADGQIMLDTRVEKLMLDNDKKLRGDCCSKGPNSQHQGTQLCLLQVVMALTKDAWTESEGIDYYGYWLPRRMPINLWRFGFANARFRLVQAVSTWC